MRRMIPSMIFASLLLLTGVRAAAAVEPYLEPTSPENVIRNIERAYASRDVDAYSACLALDFQFVFSGSTPAISWSREKDLKMTTTLFGNEKVQAIRIAFSPKGVLEKSLDPDGLLRVECDSELNVRMVDESPGGREYKARGSGIFFFRNEAATGAAPRFVIARWEDPRPTGSK